MMPAPDPEQMTALDRGFAALPNAQREKVEATARNALARRSAPSMLLTFKGNKLNIEFDCESAELAKVMQMVDMGTADPDFHLGLVGQIANLGAHGHQVDSTAANFVMAVIRSVQPRDELEALLATQMAAIHSATMMMARRLNHVSTLPQQDAAERALNKLARTYATQMEALKRYRTSGQQKVTVEHVTVNAGGQAIVGAVDTGGGGHK